MILPDPVGVELGGSINIDPGLTLAGAKAFLKLHGFTGNFGSPEVQQRFDQFTETAREFGTYAGKSLALGEGGRAAMLKHQLIVSGKFGNDLSQVNADDWREINNISRLNYLKKYGDQQFPPVPNVPKGG